MSAEDMKATVRERYGKAALRGGDRGQDRAAAARVVRDVRRRSDHVESLHRMPRRPLSLPRRCWRRSAAAIPPRWPSSIAGEVVLDLGSGGGIDVLLSARRVGPTGKAYGLDMTDEMLALARENQRKAGVENVEFLKGEIEAIPLPDNSVDVIISNCVINLSADKRQGRCARRSGCSSRAAASPCPTWWSGARCRPRSAAAWSCGSAASPAR